LSVPLLLDVKQSDGVSVLQQQAACAGVEDVVTVGSLHLLGDLILQVLYHNLKSPTVSADISSPNQ